MEAKSKLQYNDLYDWLMLGNFLTLFYPGPRGFSLFFFRERDQERAAKRRHRVAKATRRERKTSGYLGLKSHFHADDRVRI